MVRKKTVNEIEIDCEHYGQDFEKSFCYGYDNFQYPFTVNFNVPGKFVVEIKDKTATIRKVDD